MHCVWDHGIVCVLMLVRKKKQEEEEAEQKKRATEAAYQGEIYIHSALLKVNAFTQQSYFELY